MPSGYNSRMLRFTKSNWIALTGIAVAAVGIVLYTQLDRIADLRVSPAVLNSAALGSVAATVGGLLTVIVGSVIWARRASDAQVMSAAVLIGAAIVFLVTLVNVNIHGPSAILMFVEVFGVVDAVWLFLILGRRWQK